MNMLDSDRLQQACRDQGIDLPAVAAPLASYVPARASGNLLYISGQLPTIDGTLMQTGSVPGAVSPEEAKACARRCAINGLAAAADWLAKNPGRGVTGVVRLGAFVASEPGFSGQPGIVNGASEVMLAVFGDPGRHARAAVGSVALPADTPVEIDFIFELG